MAENLFWSHASVGATDRARSLGQMPMCLWLTGLSGAGKTTLARALELQLHQHGKHVYVLDGDNVRHGLNRDLGFSSADREENIRRVAEVARLMVDAGLIVIVAFISPFRAQRESARALFDSGDFVEVFVDAPFSACEARDTKGLYAKARQGLVRDFTGLDSPYEPPVSPELHLRTDLLSINECLQKILERMGVA